jgi:hypothetical protein
MKNTDHQAPHHPKLSMPAASHIVGPNIPLVTLLSKAFSLYSLSLNYIFSTLK